LKVLARRRSIRRYSNRFYFFISHIVLLV